MKTTEIFLSSIKLYSQNLMEHGVMARVHGVASVHVARAQEGRLWGRKCRVVRTITDVVTYSNGRVITHGLSIEAHKTTAPE